ncbi:hypothetical protein OBBRIDRAFT_383963 [Obba rivulosa]|uniref:Uncharacterized protein n=1 Tax=Obba rivulosa TaxID=1052685 RepID=A0A8E2AHR0_9APHY|nr:hypothetical protein OBBRIDRAFT_383963 [Obba rivulosa]
MPLPFASKLWKYFVTVKLVLLSAAICSSFPLVILALPFICLSWELQGFRRCFTRMHWLPGSDIVVMLFLPGGQVCCVTL